MRFLKKATWVVVLASVFAGSASAQEMKIGVIDVQRVLSQSPQFKEARARLEDEFAPRGREIMARQTALEEKAAKLQKDGEVMGKEEREAAERELTSEQRAIIRAQNEFREDSEIREKEVLAPVQQEVLAEVQAFGEENGYDIILAQGFVYVGPKADVTQAVLERLTKDGG